MNIIWYVVCYCKHLNDRKINIFFRLRTLASFKFKHSLSNAREVDQSTYELIAGNLDSKIDFIELHIDLNQLSSLDIKSHKNQVRIYKGTLIFEN